MGNTILEQVAQNFVVGSFYKRLKSDDRLIGERDNNREVNVYQFGISKGNYYFKRYSLLKNIVPEYYTINRFIRKDKADDYTITVYTRYLEEMPIETLSDFELIEIKDVPMEILATAQGTGRYREPANKDLFKPIDSNKIAYDLMDYLLNLNNYSIYKNNELVNTDDILLLFRHFFENGYDDALYLKTKEVPECVKKFMDAIVTEQLVDSTISRGPSVKSVKFGDEKQIDTMIHNCIYRYNLYHEDNKIEYVTDFKEFTIGEISKFRNLGKKCLKTLLLTLKNEYGIILPAINISSDIKRMLTINKYFDTSKEDEKK